MKFWLFYFLISILCISNSKAQDTDEFFVKNIHNEILIQGKCYDWLTTLCQRAPGRLSGSPAYDTAVMVMKEILQNIPDVNVQLQSVEVNVWERGEKEEVYLLTSEYMKSKLNALSLGNSVGTGKRGVQGEVVEVRSLDEVEELGIEKIKGKIVFYNRPLDPTQLNTFRAYSQAADQRVSGPSKAAEYGALAVVIRSLGLEHNDVPHTGSVKYKEGIAQIPAVAISTNDANVLSALVKKQPTSVSITNNCAMKGKKQVHNVIAEIKGSAYPDKVILVGGHLDSWDVGQGAHDDGAGCVHAMEVLRTLQALNYKPRHTIRCVLFANEENGLAGGNGYATAVKADGTIFHTACIESDAGGFTPRGFSFDADTSVLKTYYKKVTEWLPILEPYGLHFELGGSGADIGPLKFQKGLLGGLKPDTARYFDFHHTPIDNIESVHPRELKLGAAAMTSLIYLLDKYFD